MENIEALRDTLMHLSRVTEKEKFERQLNQFLYEGLKVISNSVHSNNVLGNIGGFLGTRLPFDGCYIFTSAGSKSSEEKEAFKALYHSTPSSPMIQSSRFLKKLCRLKVINIYEVKADHSLSAFSDFIGGSCLAGETKVDGVQYFCFVFKKERLAFNKNDKTLFRKYLSIVEQGIVTENTIKKRIEAENSNQAKGAFLANMSHELRSPLISIRGYAEILKEEGRNLDVQAQFLDIIVRSSDHLLAVIDEILEFSKIEMRQLKMQTQEVKLSESLGDVFGLCQAQAARKNLDLIVEKSDELPEKIATDPVRLQQVLLNLVNNAVKFTEQGQIRVDVYVENEKLCFKVSDTGIGISASDQSAVFERFYQSKNESKGQYDGTGLGLPISKEIAHLLGGELVLLESELGKGSSFLLSIPFSVLNVEGRAGNLTHLRKQSFKVLVVDDDPDSLFLSLHFLKNLGWEISSASSGPEAIDLVEKTKFDLVLMDIRMPGMDGFEANRRINKVAPMVPVIALTAHLFDDEAGPFKQHGFVDVINKPLKVEQLLEKLKSKDILKGKIAKTS